MPFFFFSLNSPLWGTTLFLPLPKSQAEAAAPSSCGRCLESAARPEEWEPAHLPVHSGLCRCSIIFPSLSAHHSALVTCVPNGCSHAAWGHAARLTKKGGTCTKPAGSSYLSPASFCLSVCPLPTADCIPCCDVLNPLCHV